MKYIIRAVTASVIAFFGLACGETAQADRIITEDTTWQGVYEIYGDLIIPDGVTLTVSSGSKLQFANENILPDQAENKLPLPRIFVQGHLEMEGDEDNPVIVSVTGAQKESGWAGIVVDDGNAFLHETRIHDAAIAVHIKKGWAKLKRSTVTGNCCGVVVQGSKSGVKIESSTLTGNRFGLVYEESAVVSFPDSVINKNIENNFFSYIPDSNFGINIICSCTPQLENEQAAISDRKHKGNGTE